MVKDLTAVSWTPRLEAQLEEILIRNAFDFKATAKDFQRYLNSDSNPDVVQTLFFKIDAKTLQLKWTDIEIRKHVIPQMQQDTKAANEAVPDEALEDDLPPLETAESHEAETDRKAPSPEKEES